MVCVFFWFAVCVGLHAAARAFLLQKLGCRNCNGEFLVDAFLHDACNFFLRETDASSQALCKCTLFCAVFYSSKHWMAVADSLSHEIEHDPVVVSSDQSSVARADILECCSCIQRFFPNELVHEALMRLYAEISFCICNMTANQLPKLYIY